MSQEQSGKAAAARLAFKIMQIAAAAMIVIAAILLIVSTAHPRVVRGLWLKAPNVLISTRSPQRAVGAVDSSGSLR